MAKSKTGLAASVKAIDPTLDALFSGSAGPVKAPSTTRYVELLPPKERKAIDQTRISGPDSADDTDDNITDPSDEEEESEDGESMSGVEDGGDEETEEEEEEEETSSQDPELIEEPLEAQKKDRKRKRKDEHDDLEDKYMRKLAEDEERETREEKRRKGENGGAVDGGAAEGEANQADEEYEAPLVHESLAQKPEEHTDVELDKANRTLFLGNISAEAISSSKAKKSLISHLESPLSDLDSSTGPHKVESIRFRSTAFSSGAMPKRAAFITKSLMTATTKSTNAYAVYSTPLAARTALKALNGSVVLDRHMRVDSVAHPTAVDHRRCVFVGNLGFVDDETVLNTNAEGETTTKKRTKVPADTEEGLWRTFEQHAGKVESVRVPRDEKTRVGKGFAYVQFYDGNDVEAALLLDGKKFPPMLPRLLRVSRAKDPRKTALAVERANKAKLQNGKAGDDKPKSTKYRAKIAPEEQSKAGRAGKLFGRSGAARQRHGFKDPNRRMERRRESAGNESALKTPEQIVFEGRRASARDGKPKDLKFGKKGKKAVMKAKTKGRGARRAAEWRKNSAKS
ncbi:hypothetical protein F4809DRAFT_587623 [Biscogniauxia mediterranea]|nr:hypothetical protein F4809DRAFT_587623 [Biscogniauxia mediterranea]